MRSIMTRLVWRWADFFTRCGIIRLEDRVRVLEAHNRALADENGHLARENRLLRAALAAREKSHHVLLEGINGED